MCLCACVLACLLPWLCSLVSQDLPKHAHPSSGANPPIHHGINNNNANSSRTMPPLGMSSEWAAVRDTNCLIDWLYVCMHVCLFCWKSLSICLSGTVRLWNYQSMQQLAQEFYGLACTVNVWALLSYAERTADLLGIMPLVEQTGGLVRMLWTLL